MLLGDLAPEGGVVLARPLELDEPVHGPEPLERVASVEEPAVVHLAQVPLDVGAGERRTAEQDGDVRQGPVVELDQVLADDERRLHEQAAHADGVRSALLGRRDQLVDAHLDPEVDHLVPVVGQDDVDQVLPDVVDVALDGGQDHRPFAALVRLLHVGLEEGHRRLHRLGRLQHEGELHLARGEALADDLHPFEQDVVDDGEGPCARLERLGEVALEPVSIAIDDALGQPAVDGPVEVLVRCTRADRGSFEEPQELLQRVVTVRPAVVHQVEAHLLGPLVDAGEREDLRRVHNGRVESRLHALVQEHRVEHLAGGGVQAEGHVGEPEDGRDAGQLALDAPDALDRLDSVLAALLHACRQRQGQRVEEQVLGGEAVALHGDVADVAGGAHLPLRRSGLTLLVDARAHDGGPEFAGQPEEGVEACAGLVSFLEVDRVEDGPPPDPLQRGAHDGPFGRVDHERHAGLGAQPARDLGHVGNTVSARVVDTDVNQVRALLDLVARHGDTGVPVGLQHRLAESFRTVGVGALAHHEERGVLPEGHRRVDGGCARFVDRRTQRRSGVGAALHHRRQVGRRGPAAATDRGDAELGDEAVQVLGQVRGGQVVVHLAVDHRGEAGVGDAGDRDAAGRREVAQSLAHLDRAGGAIEADDVDLHRVEDSQRSADLGARQHAACQLDRDLGLQRDEAVQGHHGAAGAVDRRP